MGYCFSFHPPHFAAMPVGVREACFAAPDSSLQWKPGRCRVAKPCADLKSNEIGTAAFHPGKFLKEEIEERAMLKKDAEKSLRILPHHLSEIFAGKRNISATLVVRPEKLLGISSRYCLGMLLAYDLSLAKKKEAAF